MKFIKTVKTFGTSSAVVPFSSEEVTMDIRVLISTSNSTVDLEVKPEPVEVRDIFGHLVSYTYYTYVKSTQAQTEELPF